MITYTVYLELDNALRSLEDHSVYLQLGKNTKDKFEPLTSIVKESEPIMVFAEIVYDCFP